ncbi:MAG TPA: hypothetical protein VMV83_11225 [Rectinemataceae bacterium]|nr:hypothetical protein [Rectinemataceae bacterium]
MVSKRILAVAAMAVFMLVGLSAADYASYGFTQTGTRTVDGIDYLVLVDDTGAEMLFSPLVEPGADRLNALKAIVSMLHSWSGLTLASIRATNDASQLRVTAVPSSLMTGPDDLKSALPGGLVFWYEKAIDYDFRVMSGAYAIRMTGLFTSTADLLVSLRSAYKDPAAWLLNGDPEYAVKRISELTTRVDALETALKTASDSLTQTTSDLASTTDKLTATSEELSATKAELESFEAAKASSDKSLSASTERLEAALMTALNVGFFSGPKPIAQAVVDWVVAKKTGDPSLAKAALVTAAKAEKFQATEKEIGIVLQVLYGER